MKKRIFLAALLVAVLALGAISCKKEDKAKCWKFTINSKMHLKVEAISYLWCTEAEADAYLAETKSQYESDGFTDVTAAKEEASQITTKTDCIDQNLIGLED